MPEQEPIYVNGKLFVGRVAEQKQFRVALHETLAPPVGETLPYVVLLYGDGGIGKSTLARRFRDIASTEPPFEGSFNTLWLDWEDEQQKQIALQGGRDHISPETVFDSIHAAMIRQDTSWGRQFRDYQRMITQRGEVEKQVAEILSSGGEHDELTRTMRGAATTALAKVIRWRIPIGDTGEKLAQQFLEAGVVVAAGQAAKLQQALQTRLQARLKAEQYQLFLTPHEQLALALGKGLKNVAWRNPLILFLDTYEIVDQSDIWLHEVIKAAGTRLLWVIGGRNNLVKSRWFGRDYFRGYDEAFSRRLLHYDMLQLALADVKAYFADAVPERPLTDDDADALRQATRGIPLAIRTAAEIWQRGTALADIVGDMANDTPHAEIVGQMTGRYLLHAVTEADREALYALALARGDRAVLQAMLQPEGAAAFDVGRRLAELQRAYAAVHVEAARLHDEPMAFITAYLRAENQRINPAVRRLHEQAMAVLTARLEGLQAEMPLTEERCQEEDWVQAVLDMTRYLFWLDEQRGWQWVLPRFVEGLAYSRELRRGLVHVVEEGCSSLSRRGQRRLKMLAAANEWSMLLEEEAEMLKMVDGLAQVGWLQGEGEAERRAILAWRRGKLFFQQKAYGRAWMAYDEAAKGLPARGERLQEQLADALYDLATAYLWPEGQSGAVRSPEAEKMLHRVVHWQPKRQGAWYRLGVALTHEGKAEGAINAYQTAIELDPTYAHPHNGLGTVYSDNGRYDEASAAYLKAIELDPNLANPHNNLGNVYRANGRYDEASAAYLKAIELDPNLAHPHNGLGNVYSDNGRYDEASAAYLKAIELDPTDADFHYGLGNVYRANGRYDEASAAYLKAIELDPTAAAARGSLAGSYRQLGQIAEYETQIKIAREQIAQESVYNRACFAAICGETDEALTLLEQAIAQAPGLCQSAQHDPDFDFIRDDRRFQALVGSASP